MFSVLQDMLVLMAVHVFLLSTRESTVRTHAHQTVVFPVAREHVVASKVRLVTLT